MATYSITRLERLLKLAAALLNTERLLSASEIQAKVQGYAEGKAAFRRTFERDKADLKKMGIPILKAEVPGSQPQVEGYRIRKKDYAFRDPGLTEEERAALYLAARSVRLEDTTPEAAVWPLGGHAGHAGAEDAPVMSILPADANLAELYTAVTERRRVSFDYRDEARQAEPLRLIFSRGHWYMTAYDRGKSSIRHFRVDKIVDLQAGEAGGFSPRPVEGKGPDSQPWEFGSDPLDVRLAVSEEMADLVLRQLEETPQATRREDGSLLLELKVANPDPFLDFVLSLLEHGELLEPPELREKLLERLRSAARAQPSEPASAPLAGERSQETSVRQEQPTEEPKAVARTRKKLDPLDRLQRLLQLVPWVTERGGAPLSEISQRFDYPSELLLADLQSILFMVGVPPYTPDSLIEVWIYEDGWVNIAYADFFSQPLHLTPEQALSLIAAGSVLQTLQHDSALASGLQKLTDMLGVKLGEAIQIQLGKGEGEFLETLQRACKRHEKTEIDYYSYNRDDFTRRVVRPFRLWAKDGAWYLRGYCETAQDERTFRIDRITRLELLSTTFAPPTWPVSDSVWDQAEDAAWVELRLSPSAQWVLDYYPNVLKGFSGEVCQARFQVSALPWLERLLLKLNQEVEIVDSYKLPDNPAAAAALRILAVYGE